MTHDDSFPPLDLPSTTPSFAIPPGAPAEHMKTRIVIIDEHSEKATSLGQLTTIDDVMGATNKMTFGAIVGMVNWCKSKGTTARWRFRRIGGKIPLPWMGLISLFILIYGMGAGWRLDVLTVILMFFLLFIIAGAYLSAEYENTGRDICFICGTGCKDARFGKPIHTIDSKSGRKKLITQSGYCDECAWNVYRKNLWTAAEASIWNLIRQHPKQVRTWWRVVAYKLFWWKPIRYLEHCVDPRPVGRGNTYTKLDRKNPMDDVDINELDKIQNLAVTMYNAAERAKRLTRRGI